MKNFKLKLITLLIYGCCIFLINVNCNEISQGDQRRKLEFLYKMSNYASILKEFSNGLTYYGDLDFFEKKANNLKDEINKSESVKNWGKSVEIKVNLMSILSEDLKSVSELKKKNLPTDQNIRNDDEVLMINRRIYAFNEELSNIIIQVGKE